jgi:hypothetical protein
MSRKNFAWAQATFTAARSSTTNRTGAGATITFSVFGFQPTTERVLPFTITVLGTLFGSTFEAAVLEKVRPSCFASSCLFFVAAKLTCP